MINQIEDMKHKIDELEYTLKNKSDENETLKEENKSLKQRIKDLEDACNGNCFAKTNSENVINKDKLIESLQDHISRTVFA